MHDKLTFFTLKNKTKGILRQLQWQTKIKVALQSLWLYAHTYNYTGRIPRKSGTDMNKLICLWSVKCEEWRVCEVWSLKRVGVGVWHQLSTYNMGCYKKKGGTLGDVTFWIWLSLVNVKQHWHYPSIPCSIICTGEFDPVFAICTHKHCETSQGAIQY